MTQLIRNLMFDNQLITMVRDAAYRVYLDDRHPYAKYKHLEVMLNVDVYGDNDETFFPAVKQRILSDNLIDIKEERYLERFVSAFRWGLTTIDDDGDDDNPISIEELSVHEYYVDCISLEYDWGRDDTIVVDAFLNRITC